MPAGEYCTPAFDPRGLRGEVGIRATVSGPHYLTGIRPRDFLEADFRPGMVSGLAFTERTTPQPYVSDVELPVLKVAQCVLTRYENPSLYLILQPYQNYVLMCSDRLRPVLNMEPSRVYHGRKDLQMYKNDRTELAARSEPRLDAEPSNSWPGEGPTSPGINQLKRRECRVKVDR